MTPPAPPSPPSALVTALTEQARGWRHVTLAPHSPRAVAFRLGDAVIGVLHHDGRLDVPVPPPLRTVVLEEAVAGPHPTRPDADWVSLPLQDPDDLTAVTLLLRLSYLYRRLLRSRHPDVLRRIRLELDEYDLPSPVVGLYDTMIAKRTAPPARPPNR